MALSSWAQSLIPVIGDRLSGMGINPANAPIFAAQLDLETAGGSSSLAKRSNNYAGIGGLGNYRRYASPSEGVQGYLDLLAKSKHYQPVLAAARSGGVEDVARALGNSPWAAGRYRQGVAGNEDVRGIKPHADGTWGIVGTEGSALLAKLGKGGGPSGWRPGAVAPDLAGRNAALKLQAMGHDLTKFNIVMQNGNYYAVPNGA